MTGAANTAHADDWSDTMAAWSVWSRGASGQALGHRGGENVKTAGSALQSQAPHNVSRNQSNPLHHNPSPSSNATEDGATMHPTSSRTIHDIALGAAERVPSRRDARDLIRVAFTNSLPAGRYPAKQIAGEIGASQSTVEGWRSPDGMMSADFLVLLQVRYPRFDAELRRLFKLRRELDPNFQRELADLLRRVV